MLKDSTCKRGRQSRLAEAFTVYKVRNCTDNGLSNPVVSQRFTDPLANPIRYLERKQLMAGLRKMPIKLSPPPDPIPEQATAKYRRVFEYLHGHIQSGVLKAGDRLPSEAELGKLFDASRITVAKAVLDLQRMGLVSRRPGAGTHVLAPQMSGGRTFGLLIPELGLTEIFEPICHGMMRSSFARPDALLWGNASTSARAKRPKRPSRWLTRSSGKTWPGCFLRHWN